MTVGLSSIQKSLDMFPVPILEKEWIERIISGFSQLANVGFYLERFMWTTRWSLVQAMSYILKRTRFSVNPFICSQELPKVEKPTPEPGYETQTMRLYWMASGHQDENTLTSICLSVFESPRSHMFMSAVTEEWHWKPYYESRSTVLSTYFLHFSSADKGIAGVD